MPERAAGAFRIFSGFVWYSGITKIARAAAACAAAPSGGICMNRIRSRLAPLAALMALLLALAGCSAAPSTEEPGTASQTKYATGKYTQTEVTPAVDSGFAPAKLQMLDGVPTLSLYNDAQNTAAAFSWTGDGWETIDPSTVQIGRAHV